MDLSGNKILITGATQGIGRSLATKFLELGNTVLAVGRDPQALADLGALDRKIVPMACDLADPSALERLVALIHAEHADLNVLVNNAGIQYTRDFSDGESRSAQIAHEIHVNLTVPILLVDRLLPVIRTNANAAVVNVSSGLGLVPKKQAPVYCATKAGVHIFSKALRYQLADVKVFEIIPPLVDTKMTQGRGGAKLSPAQLVDEFLDAFAQDRYEVCIGKVKLLKLVNRIAPALAESVMRNGR